MLNYINNNLEKIKIIIFSFGVSYMAISLWIIFSQTLSGEIKAVLTYTAIGFFTISFQFMKEYRKKVLKHNQKMKSLFEEYKLTEEKLGRTLYLKLERVFNKYIDRKIYLPEEEVRELLFFLSNDFNKKTYANFAIILDGYYGFFEQTDSTFKKSRELTLKKMRKSVDNHISKQEAIQYSEDIDIYNKSLKRKSFFFDFME